MICLISNIREKIEISYKTVEILEKIITAITGDKREEPVEKEKLQRSSVYKDLDTLNKFMIRSLQDAEILDSIVSGGQKIIKQ